MNNSIRFDSLDALLYASMKYVGSKDLEEYESISEDITFSPKGKQRLIKRLMKEKEYIENHKIYRPAKEIFKHLAVAILVAITLLFTACMCIEPIREAIWEIVTEWYDDYILVEVVEVVDSQINNKTAINSELKTPTTILEHKEPTISKDYIRYLVVDLPHQYCLEYEKENIVIEYRQTLLSNYTLLTSNNDTEIFDVVINGNEGKHTSFTSGEVILNSVFWHDSEYCYYLFGNESKEFMIQLAESIE